MSSSAAPFAASPGSLGEKGARCFPQMRLLMVHQDHHGSFPKPPAFAGESFFNLLFKKIVGERARLRSVLKTHIFNSAKRVERADWASRYGFQFFSAVDPYIVDTCNLITSACARTILQRRGRAERDAAIKAASAYSSQAATSTRFDLLKTPIWVASSSKMHGPSVAALSSASSAERYSERVIFAPHNPRPAFHPLLR